MSATPRKKKCKACGKFFTPTRPMQTTCCLTCAIEWSSKPKAKKAYSMEKKKELAKKYPDKSKWLANAQKVVNEYIRLRDQNKTTCISCDYKFSDNTRQIHASHFKPQGNNQQLRFYTLNIWASCSICNNHLSGNLVPYRARLIEKLGIEKVEEIEANHSRGHYTVEYLEKLIKVFRKKIRLYKRKFR